MNKVRQIIRLHTEGINKSEISKLSSVSRNTVKRYLKIFIRQQLTYEQVCDMNNHQLSLLFAADESNLISEKVKLLQSLLPWIEKELRRRTQNRTITCKGLIER